MNKYYKPEISELENGLPLEFYHEHAWHPFVYKAEEHQGMELEDIRVKYLDSLDFNALGYTCKKTFLGKQTQIKDILDDGSEITEEIDIFDEEVLSILKRGHPVGEFLPFAPNMVVPYNVKYEGKTHIVKNLHELRKILK